MGKFMLKDFLHLYAEKIVYYNLEYIETQFVRSKLNEKY
jgi:hypothetical protein